MRALTVALLGLLTLACFWPGLTGPFVHDDLPNLYHVRVGEPSLESVLDVAVRNPSGLLRRPLSNLSLAANYWSHGLSAWGFKFTNLLTHLLTGWLVFLFSRNILRIGNPDTPDERKHVIALGACAIWLLHPLQVSTVMYVVQRMAQLSTLFVLLGCLLWSGWLLRGDFRWPATLRMMLATSTSLLAALLSKENGALFPLLFAVITWLWWERRRPPQQAIPASLRASVYLFIVIPVVAGLAIAANNPDMILGSYAWRDFTPGERLATEGKILWFYVQLFLLPFPSSMGLFHDDIAILSPASWQALVAWLAWFALVIAAISIRRRFPLLAFAVLWFLLSHAMESTILGLELAYEHRNYLALIGPALALSYGLLHAIDRFAPQRRMVLLGLVMLVLATATFSRAIQWGDKQRFFATEFRNHPNSPRAILSDVARHHELGAPPSWFEAQIPRLRAAHDDAVWPLLIHASLQCANPSHRVPWQDIASEIRAGANIRQLDEQFKVVIGRLVERNCPHLDVSEFIKLMQLTRLRALADGDGTIARVLSRYIGWTYRETGDVGQAAAWYRQAASEAPEDRVEELFELAYFLLNNDAIDELPGVIAELDRRRERFTLPIGYRIDEIRGFYSMLLQEAGSQNP